MGSSLLPPRFAGGGGNFVTDSLVWLPCPALLKLQWPSTRTHQQHVYEQALGGWTIGMQNAWDYKRNGESQEHLSWGSCSERLGWWETRWIYIAVRDFKQGVWHLNGLVVGAAGGGSCCHAGWAKESGHTHCWGFVCGQLALFTGPTGYHRSPAWAECVKNKAKGC